MNYWLGVATLTGIYMIAILGVSILTGFTGLFSMGHAGFMAIGAYTSALVTKTFHLPVLVGVFLGMFKMCIRDRYSIGTGYLYAEIPAKWTL